MTFSPSATVPANPPHRSSFPETQPGSFLTARSSPSQKEEQRWMSSSLDLPCWPPAHRGRGTQLGLLLYKCPVRLFILSMHFLGFPSSVNCPPFRNLRRALTQVQTAGGQRGGGHAHPLAPWHAFLLSVCLGTVSLGTTGLVVFFTFSHPGGYLQDVTGFNLYLTPTMTREQ